MIACLHVFGGIRYAARTLRACPAFSLTNIAILALGIGAATAIPASQVPDGISARNNRLLPLTWVVRTGAPSAFAAAASLHELRQSGGGLPVQRVRTLTEVVAASAARTRFYALLRILFAAIALLLAALGARPDDVRNMVIWQGMRLALLGIAIGIPGALALTRVMDSVIFGVRTWDPAVFGAVAALLAAVTFLAAWAPSRGATRVDPADALRSARWRPSRGRCDGPARCEASVGRLLLVLCANAEGPFRPFLPGFGRISSHPEGGRREADFSFLVLSNILLADDPDRTR